MYTPDTNHLYSILSIQSRNSSSESIQYTNKFTIDLTQADKEIANCYIRVDIAKKIEGVVFVCVLTTSLCVHKDKKERLC